MDDKDFLESYYSKIEEEADAEFMKSFKELIDKNEITRENLMELIDGVFDGKER